MKSHWEQFQTEEWKKGQFRSKLLLGILVIAAGIILFLIKLGYPIPTWLISWPMVLIAAGLISQVKHNFKHVFGYILMAVGGAFLLKKFHPELIDTSLLWPLILVFIGASVIYKTFSRNKKKESAPLSTVSDSSEQTTNDTFESNAIFGGINKQVVSKNFRSAEINSVFGGHEINMSQADFQGEANMEINAVFGGVTLIIPSNWTVKSELNTVFGSVEDKRPSYNEVELGSTKVLQLNGNCVFGGIEIKSF